MGTSVKSIGLSTEESNDEFVVSDELLEAIAVRGGGWWSGLLHNVADDGVLGSSSLVVIWVSSPIIIR
jgi:hypothetical protein